MPNARLFGVLLLSPLALQCRQPMAGTSASGVVQDPPVPTVLAPAGNLQHGNALAQPFIELHTYRQIPHQCIQNRDCPDPDVCHHAACSGGMCMGNPRDAVPCTAIQSDGVASPGTCFAGQCVTEARWAEACGRVMGHMYGKHISSAGYRYEYAKCSPVRGAAECLDGAKESFSFLAASSAKRLLKCLQYPHLTPPEGYLFNWDGNDFSDFKGKGARQP